MTDFTLTDHGSITLLTPLSDAGQEWAAEHLPVEPWQMLGAAIAIEPRYVGAIVDGLLSDGLTVEEG
jgi:hypothetical protein